MNEVKYQIFISSTYRDLKDEREVVIKTILSMRHIPIGMELFSAEDEEQWNIIKRTIDESDYYILIIGSRYGSETSEGISFTEKEYDYALSKSIPILAYVISETAIRTPPQTETNGSKLEKLKKFKNKVLTNNKMSEFWDDKNDLGRLISIALPKSFDLKPRIGWIKADKVATQDVLKEMAELSKENRQLREVLDSLAKGNNRLPKLELSIDESTNLTINKKLLSSSQINPKPIKPEEIPEHLKKYISDEDLKKYNESLPAQETIDRYNKEIFLYQCIHENQQEIKFKLKNNGNIKANNINVFLEFPPEIFVFKEELSDEDNIKKPERPQVGENPISKATYLYNEENESLEKKWPGADIFWGMGPKFDTSIYIPKAFTNVHSVNHWASVQDKHKLRLFKNNLLHTLSTSFDSEDGFKIVPTEAGEFVINIKIVCEEYAEPDFFSIKLFVHETEEDS